jgi:hypothetical protein
LSLQRKEQRPGLSHTAVLGLQIRQEAEAECGAKGRLATMSVTEQKATRGDCGILDDTDLKPIFDTSAQEMKGRIQHRVTALGSLRAEIEFLLSDFSVNAKHR